MKTMFKVLYSAAKNEPKELILSVVYLSMIFGMYYFLILIGG
jgi:hypothetical protein